MSQAVEGVTKHRTIPGCGARCGRCHRRARHLIDQRCAAGPLQ